MCSSDLPFGSNLRGTDVAIEGSYQKGRCYRLMGEDEKALAQFQALSRNYPASLFAGRGQVQVGLIYYEEKRYQESLDVLNAVASSRTDVMGAEAQYSVGLAYFAMEKYADATAAFLRVKYVYPDASEWIARAYLKLGETYELTKDFGKARDAYQMVLNSNRENEYGRDAEARLKKLEQL